MRYTSRLLALLHGSAKKTITRARISYDLWVVHLWDWGYDDAVAAHRHLAHNYDFRPFWIALGHLFAGDWWKRMWIVQEFVLAKNIHFVCGQRGVRWVTLSRATTLLFSDPMKKL